VDADSDQNLADMLGVDLQKEEVKTISDVLYDIQQDKEGEGMASMPLPNKIEYLLNTSCLYESEKFDIISVGVKWTQGCYCMPNNILRSIIPKIAGAYKYTIIDSPAGLEHLNRRIITEVDDIFVILDPSRKALKNVERVKKITSEIGIKFKNMYLVANHKFEREKEKYIQNTNERYLGKIEYDPKIEEYSWAGRSLIELPENSPALFSVGRILMRAGYRK